MKGSVAQSGLFDADIERDCPLDAGYPANPCYLDFAQWDHLIHLFYLCVEDPDLGSNVTDRGRGPEHETTENRSLLGHQERAKGQPHDQHHVLRPIPEEHQEGDTEHKYGGC